LQSLKLRLEPLGQHSRIPARQHLLEPGLAPAHHRALRFRDAEPFGDERFQGGVGLAILGDGLDARSDIGKAGGILLQAGQRVASGLGRQPDGDDETLSGLASGQRGVGLGKSPLDEGRHQYPADHDVAQEYQN
jgi:hypothetical protein